MLKEIHVWFVDNLRDATLAEPRGELSLVVEPPLSQVVFELRQQDPEGDILLCYQASLDPSWKTKSHRTPNEESVQRSQPLFSCQCQPRTSEGRPPHGDQLARFARKFN
jgi:hypothetical protein